MALNSFQYIRNVVADDISVAAANTFGPVVGWCVVVWVVAICHF